MFNLKQEKERQRSLDSYIHDQINKMILLTAGTFVISGIIGTLTGGPLIIIIAASVSVILLGFFVSMALAVCCPRIHPDFYNEYNDDVQLKVAP